MTMEDCLALIFAIDDLGLRKSTAQSDLIEKMPDFSFASDANKIPRYSETPINAQLVLDYMKAEGDNGSYEFWTEKLESLGGKSRMESWAFPVELTDLDNVEISYNFRDSRGGRTHAGLDVYTKENSPIHAVTDGIVMYQGWFYDSEDYKIPVYQVVVLNFDGSVVRYGEMHDRDIAVGTIVKKGDIVGFTKKMDSNTMLHVEVFENIDQLNEVFRYDLSTPSSKYSNISGSGFKRRGDLINPTMIGALGIYNGSPYDLTWELTPNYNFPKWPDSKRRR